MLKKTTLLFILISIFNSYFGADILTDYQAKDLKKVDHLDNKIFNKWLSKNIDDNGIINYKKGKKKEKDIEKYFQYLLAIDFEQLKGPAERLAYFINLYNAAVVYGILKQYPVTSLKENGSDGLFFEQKFYFKGTLITINDLEKQFILKRFKEPLIHFALYTGAISSPSLLKSAYVGENLKKTLIQKTQDFLSNHPDMKVDNDKKILSYSQLFDWYKESLGDVKVFYNKYASSPVADNVKLELIKYNWSLNESKSKSKKKK